MIFDTHTHYDDSAFDSDREELLENLKKNGVGRICNIGASMQGARDSVLLSEKYDFVYAAAGVHPDEVYDFTPGLSNEEAEKMFKTADSDTTEISAEKEISENYAETSGAKSESSAEIPKGKNENPAVLPEAECNDFDTDNLIDEGRKTFDELKMLIGHEKTVAVGEIGLDYHGYDIYDVKPEKEIQKYWFEKQLGLAVETGKPVVIHSRNACSDTMEIMKKAHERGLSGAVIHCFSYSKETAAEYLDMGFYLGFGGVITYEGQKKLTKALEITPPERILIETDCPYLLPVPVREKGRMSRNSSIYLPYVINKIAEIKKMSAEQIEKITWENACRFYGIDL